MPEDMPDHMPEDMPDRMPNRMSEDMSDRMPEDLPVRKCINVMVGITRSKVIFLSVKHHHRKASNDVCPVSSVSGVRFGVRFDRPRSLIPMGGDLHVCSIRSPCLFNHLKHLKSFSTTICSTF